MWLTLTIKRRITITCYRIQTTASTALSNVGYAFIELDMPQSWHWYAYAELVISFFLSCCNRRKKKNQTLGQSRQKSFQQVNDQMMQMKTQLVLPKVVEMVVDLSTVGVPMLGRLDSYSSVVQKEEPSGMLFLVQAIHLMLRLLRIYQGRNQNTTGERTFRGPSFCANHHPWYLLNSMTCAGNSWRSQSEIRCYMQTTFVEHHLYQEGQEKAAYMALLAALSILTFEVHDQHLLQERLIQVDEPSWASTTWYNLSGLLSSPSQQYQQIFHQ